LTSKGIQTLIHYPTAPHHQEAFSKWAGRSYPIAEKIHAEELSLPIGPTMTMEQVDMVIAAVNSFKG